MHGGQYPVQGSTVNVYAASTSGYGGASVLKTSGTAPVTNSSGTFSINYTCSTGQELYLVATGGDPLNDGLGSNNTALIMTAAMGPCGSTFSSSYNIDEVTTVATEYALAGFSTGYLNVGSSSTNVTGLDNAFATVQNLVNLSSGQALTATPGYAATVTSSSPDTYYSVVPFDTINALANVLASCVNTAASTSAACTSLFSYTGGSNSLSSGHGVNNSPNAASTLNTADAALYIAHNPGLPNGSFTSGNVAALLNLAGTGAPFGPAVKSTINDLTLTLSFTGGGLGGTNGTNVSGAGMGLAIDQTGNVWITNSNSLTLTELSPLGAPLSPTTTSNQTSPYATIKLGGYTGGGLKNPSTVAIDQSGDAWVADGLTCLVEFKADTNSTGSSALSPLTGFTTPCAGKPTGAFGVAIDGQTPNQIWVSGQSYVSAATSTGTVASGFPYSSGLNSVVTFLGPDYSGHVWYMDGGNGVFGALNSNGTSYSTTGAVLSGPTDFATFAPLSGTLTLFWGEGNDIAYKGAVGGNAVPPLVFQESTITGQTEDGGFATDGNARIYLAVESNNSATPDNLTVFTPSGTQISPVVGGYTGGSSLTALAIPQAIAVDQAGNVWVVNQNNAQINPHSVYTSAAAVNFLNKTISTNATVTEFVGLAAPVNPVFSSAAKLGSANPTATNTTGSYGNLP